MFWKFVYILCFLSQWFCNSSEIEEHELEIPYEHVSSSEYKSDLASIFEPIVSDKKLMDSEEVQDEDEDEDEDTDASTEKYPAEDGVSFAGPVKAKGTVSVAATFGYDAPTTYPLALSNGPSWLPPLFSQHFLSSYPLTASPPVPLTFSYIPLLAMSLPGTERSPFLETTLDNVLKEQKPVSKEIFLKLTPLKNEEEILPITSNSANSSAELKPEDMLENSVELVDEDFTDDDAMEEADKLSTTDDLTMKDSKLPRVFSGFVPASGTVKIAARF